MASHLGTQKLTYKIFQKNVRDITIDINTSTLEFNTRAFVAYAGEKLRITLKNPSGMQHNMVVVKKKHLQSFGKKSEKYGLNLKAAENSYVPPNSDEVIFFSPVVSAGHNAVFEAKVPNKVGSYPYICTIPGHWVIMQGIMNVVPSAKKLQKKTSNSINFTLDKAPTYKGKSYTVLMTGGSKSHRFAKYWGVTDGKLLNDNGKNKIVYTENLSDKKISKLLKESDIFYLTNNQAFEKSLQP